MKRILLVEPDDSYVRFLEPLFAAKGFFLVTVPDGAVVVVVVAVVPPVVVPPLRVVRLVAEQHRDDRDHEPEQALASCAMAASPSW